MTYLIRFIVFASMVFGSLLMGEATLRAQDTADGNPDEGTIIQIGPDRGAQQPKLQQGWLDRRVPNRGSAPVVVSRYWIGIEGVAPSPALRMHLELGPEEGLLVNRIMPNSPAEKGELEQYDIITRVNGKPIATILELAEHVGEQGEKKGRLAIEIIRRGKPRTLWVTPAERPLDQLNVPQPRRPFGIDGHFGGEPFGDQRFGGEFGNFNRQLFQNGVSVSLSQQNNGPPQIIVKKGDQTWEIVGDDPEALQALPDDVRPLVERMLNQPAGNGRRGFDGFDQNFQGNQFPPQELFQQKLEELQRQMEALQEPFGGAGGFPEEPLPEQQTPFEENTPSEIELPAETQ